jgi:hypothetical protein
VAPAGFSSNVPVLAFENMGRNQRSMLFASPTLLGDGRTTLLNSAQGNQLLLIDPSRGGSGTTRLVNLDLSNSYPIASPLAVAGSLMVPLENAQLVLLDPQTGSSIGTPFQPTIAAGERPVWLNPVLLSDNQSVVIADQKRNLYKLSTGKQLRVMNSQPLELPLQGRLSVIDDVVVGVTPGASGDSLEFYETAEFKKTASIPFEGRFAWGPYVVEGSSGALGLALSDIEGLVAFQADGKTAWSVPLPGLVLVGQPLRLEKEILLAGTMGELVRVSLQDGSIVARGSASEPLSGTPVLLDGQLLAPGDEGVLVRLPLPDSLEANPSGGAL